MTGRQKAIAGIGVLITMVLAILDQNIVATASWPIVRELDPAHGLERLPWLITAYALAATAALPLYGKLCDVYGAKPVYLGAMATFLLGSALCGLSQTMGQLIAFRAVQGLGGGGLMSVTLVVAAHLAPADKRASAGGAGGLLAGIGLVAGPLLGGLFTDALSWRWIFLINLPLGLLVLVTAALAIKLDDGGLRHRIDYAGAALAAAAASVLLLIVEWGGSRYAWSSPVILAMIATDVALIAAFCRRQLTAPEPILPFAMFRDPTLRVALPLQFLTGFGMAGGIFYTIVYLQAAVGIPAAESGLYLIPMAAGMVVSGTVSGVLIARGRSSKPFLLSGLALTTAAMLLLARLPGEGAPLLLGPALVVLGLGFGMVLGIAIFLVQDAAAPAQLGVATTATRFFQILGTALGTAVFGLVLNRATAAGLPSGFGLETLSSLASLPSASRAHVVEALVGGLHAVFIAGAGVMALALLLAALLPSSRRTSAEPPPPVPVDA